MNAWIPEIQETKGQWCFIKQKIGLLESSTSEEEQPCGLQLPFGEEAIGLVELVLIKESERNRTPFYHANDLRFELQAW